jgi:hypothetical protein
MTRGSYRSAVPKNVDRGNVALLGQEEAAGL